MKPQTVQVFLGTSSSGDRSLYSKDGPAGAPVVSHLPVAILRPSSDRAATETPMGRAALDYFEVGYLAVNFEEKSP